jgi:hypothetical protein
MRRVIEGQGCAVLLHSWVYPHAFEDAQTRTAVQPLLDTYPCDTQIILRRNIEIYQAPPHDPGYGWIKNRPAVPPETKAMDAQSPLVDWSQLDEVLAAFPCAESPTSTKLLPTQPAACRTSTLWAAANSHSMALPTGLSGWVLTSNLVDTATGQWSATISNLDGSNPQVFEGTQNDAISPDGSQFVYSVYNEGITIANLTSSKTARSPVPAKAISTRFVRQTAGQSGSCAAWASSTSSCSTRMAQTYVSLRMVGFRNNQSAG